MPQADATGLAPEKSANPPSRTTSLCGRAWFFPACQRINLNFFGEVSERRPWAFKREDRPAPFAGRSESVLLRDRIPPLSTRVSILSSRKTRVKLRQFITGRQPEKSRRIYLANVGGKERDPLQHAELSLLSVVARRLYAQSSLAEPRLHPSGRFRCIVHGLKELFNLPVLRPLKRFKQRWQVCVWSVRLTEQPVVL
jgi:hypothetical protein